MEAVLKYLFSLLKRLIFLGIVCAAAPMVLISLGYPRSTAMEVYSALYLICLPWLLWFQQMYYLGIGRNRKGFAHIRTAFFSSLFCTALVLALFPFIPSSGTFSLEDIPLHPSLSKGSILSFPEGTLVINPAGVTPEVKALWYGGRKLYFTNITTNGESLSLEGREPIEVPFREDYPLLNSSRLGRRAASLWLDNMLLFHRHLENFTLGYGALSSSPENTAFAKIFLQESKALSNNQVSLNAYPRLFFAVLGLYLFACLLGVLFSIRQHYLGSLSLTCLVSWGASGFVLQALQHLSYLIPMPYLFEIGLCLGSLILIGLLYGFSFPPQKWKFPAFGRRGGSR